MPLLSRSQDLSVTSYPLKAVLHNPNATRNIAKWAVDLVEFELDFLPHHAVKSQVLADYMIDWTPPPCHPGGPDDNELEVKAPVFTEPHWILFFDDSSHK
jgi:ribonuclease HI